MQFLTTHFYIVSGNSVRLQLFRERLMRKSIPAFLLLALFGAPSVAQADGGSSGRIEVLVDGARSADGVVGVALFNAKKGFPDNRSMALQGRSVPAGKRCKVIFENVPYGVYAISVLHDENGNGNTTETRPSIHGDEVHSRPLPVDFGGATGVKVFGP